MLAAEWRIQLGDAGVPGERLRCECLTLPQLVELPVQELLWCLPAIQIP